MKERAKKNPEQLDVTTFNVNTTRACGIERLLQDEAEALNAYLHMRDLSIESLGLSDIGSFVSVDVENPHTNLILSGTDQLLGSVVRIDCRDDLKVLTKSSVVDDLYRSSERRYNRLDEDGVQQDSDSTSDLILTVTGRVVDYTLGVKRLDKEVEGDHMLIHLDLHPFTSTRTPSIVALLIPQSHDEIAHLSPTKLVTYFKR